MIFDIHGTLAPVFTPFDGSGQVNYGVMAEYMAHLDKHDIGGILVGGTTGEAMSLSVSERKSVLEAWLEVARPLGAKVIAQVGGAALPDVVELARHAELAGVDAIMTLPELYYKPRTVEQLVRYLRTVSEAAVTLPLIYYHFPMMTGVDVNIPQLFSEAASRIPTFRGMKADLGVAVQVTDQLVEDRRIFIANHHIAPAVLMGHDCSIATVTNMFPGLVHDIIDAVQSGDVMKAKSLQERINKLVEVIAVQDDFVPSMKCAMEVVTGVKVGPPRQPLSTFNQKQTSSMEETLKNLGVQIY